MYNQYSKQKFTISKATLLTLKKKEQELNYEIDVLTREINVPNLNQKRQELERIERQIEHNQTERVHVERQKQNKAGLINKIFGEKELKPDAQNRFEKLSKEYQLLEKRRADLKEFRTSKVEYKIEQIRKKKEVLEKVSNRIKQLERRKDTVTVLKNQAALKNKEKRQIGEAVRRKLEKNDNCPYCGELISGSGHVDHIYPMSKGGHSVKKNMVHVCEDCNLKKSNLTLTIFIRKFKLDRNEIEDRLFELGKEF